MCLCQFPDLMVMLCSQAIIQAMRESGVFSSVIALAEVSLSKDKFLSSIESSNTTRGVKSGIVSSRKMGDNNESEATARRVLECSNDAIYASAIPPQSPPGLDDVEFDTTLQTTIM